MEDAVQSETLAKSMQDMDTAAFDAECEAACQQAEKSFAARSSAAAASSTASARSGDASICGNEVQQGIAANLQAAAAREAKINGLIAGNEATLQRLKDEHKGKRGSYNKKDQATKSRADAALKYLREGVLPEERVAPPKLNVHTAAATARSSTSTVERLAHPQMAPAGR
jgi:hypothetical protein